MDDDMEVKKIVEESIRDISEVASSSQKNEKVVKNFAIRASLGRRRKVRVKQDEKGESDSTPETPDSLKRQTPEGGNPLSVSDATLSEIDLAKAQESPSTASAEPNASVELPISVDEDVKPHRVETVADRVSLFQQLPAKKSPSSSIRSKIAKRFHIAEPTVVVVQESIEEDQQSAFMQQEDIDSTRDAEKRESVSFAVGTAVRPPQPTNLSLLRHITSLESDSEDLSIDDPRKTFSPSETSLRRIAYVAQASKGSQDEPLNKKHLNRESSAEDLSLGAELAFDQAKMPAHGDLIADNVGPNMTPSGQTSGGKKEHLYKILVIGELGTGKTSFIKRYVHQFFSNNYRATIGVDFALKVIPWDENTIVRLQLWDIAGQERFGNMTRVYYKEAVGAFIVFDVTRSATFDAVAKWKQDLDAKVQLPDGTNIPCVLLANKCDQEKQGFVCNSAKMEEYVKENKFTAWFETSAKENINIEESAKALVTKILINDKTILADPADEEKVMLTNSTHSTSKSCVC
ncbi:Ras-related protein Rab [Sergentomyia squamirostris]